MSRRVKLIQTRDETFLLAEGRTFKSLQTAQCALEPHHSRSFVRREASAPRGAPSDRHVPGMRRVLNREFSKEVAEHVFEFPLFDSGTHSSFSGLTSETECNETLPGYYSSTGSVAPIPCGAPALYCPGGTAQPLIVSEGSETYTDTSLPNAPPDSMATRTSQRPCSVGFYCQAGLLIPCNQGAFASGAGSTVCTNCVAGEYQSSASATACDACDAGGWCGAGASAVTLCDAGSFRAAAGGASQADCAECPTGSFCVSGATTPELCAEGRYGDAPNQSSAQCAGACAAGHWCGAGSTSATNSLCDPGLFNPSQGAASAGACQPCSAGSFSASAGSSACDLCVGASFQNATGATECRNCSACAVEEYEVVPCTGSTDSTCVACSNIECGANQFRAGSCSGTTNGYVRRPQIERGTFTSRTLARACPEVKVRRSMRGRPRLAMRAQTAIAASTSIAPEIAAARTTGLLAAFATTWTVTPTM